METHHELAALVARLGPAVLEDPNDFRAAFDDHAPAGAASDGQVNLLTDAIRLGTLARTLTQLGDGAQPGHTLDAQAFRLAALRGGADVVSARWALAALLFALGRVGEDEVVRPLPRTVLPEDGTVLTGTVLPLPLTAEPPTRGRSWRGLVVTVFLGLAVVFVVAIGVGAVLVGRGDVDLPEPGPSGAPTTREVHTVPAGTVVTTTATGSSGTTAVPAATMAGRTGGVRVAGLGVPEQVDGEDGPLVAAPGTRLHTFTLTDGPCQEAPCQPWSALGLQVVVEGRSSPLPAGGPSYAVAVPEGGGVELRFDADRYDQRVSLVDGAATGRNIAVLTRSDREVDVDTDVELRPTANAPLGPEAVRSVHVGDARLFFFNGPRGLPRPKRAYLTVEVTYTTAGDGRPRTFELGELHLEAADGTPYPRRDLTPDTPTADVAFVVPASFTTGTLVIQGTRRVTTRTSEGGTGTVLLTLPRTAVDVRFG